MATCRDGNGDTWRIYQSGTDWRWQRTASNGKVVGASTESYRNKADCIANARRHGMSCSPI